MASLRDSLLCPCCGQVLVSNPFEFTRREMREDDLFGVHIHACSPESSGDSCHSDWSVESSVTLSECLLDQDDSDCWSFAFSDEPTALPSQLQSGGSVTDDELTRTQLDWMYEKATSKGEAGAAWFNQIGNLFFRRGQCDEAMAAYTLAMQSNQALLTELSGTINELSAAQAVQMAARAATLNNMAAVNYVRGDTRAAYESFCEAHRWSSYCLLSAAGEFCDSKINAVSVIATIDSFRRMHIQRGEVWHAFELSRWMQSFESVAAGNGNV